ncbi:glycine--tRNA ligase subunit beta [Alteromonas sp. a30]|uniref:glycine--tRNA ligase subunit beta n=1 Tax=Alteromonas sp. a30 TaxID=2730917 RepID=UPI00227FDB06|nr:glycine--tRNA ligase subunit beta [Alteromonas sp. a30]MCY7295430.1 glycine--tRNA ligase subunit beta [Alteromonas sp. a30]
MLKNDLIIEIGTEELPPKSLKKLAVAFKNNIEAGLTQATLAFDDAKWFATPKRLAVYVTALQEKQEDTIVEKRGPAVSAAFDADGNPTKAAMGWAKGNGIEVADADRLVTEKGEWLVVRKEEAGKPLSELLEGIVEQALKQLPIPKPMRWGNSDVEFVRPIHSVLALFGSQVVNITIKGKKASDKVQGHRFHSPTFVSVPSASEYVSVLKEHSVYADYEERKHYISTELKRTAEALGAVVDMEDELLEEVTSLVELPVIMQANFEEHFLKVPKEALIYTMKGDQKYFPLLDNNGNLLPTFLFVSNIKSSSPEKVIAGNEKVIRPRLADAEFFYNTDLKNDFASNIEKLNNIVFQKQLGTIKERVERISVLASFIADNIGGNSKDAARAGLLCKNDLVSNMVLEFPAMQGIMGRYYSAANGENESVSTAIGEQYLPAFSGDALPSTKESASVALAEKLDTLVGIFATGQTPKGDKDPFALRRAAIGILRICIEKDYALDLCSLISKSASLVQSKFEKPVDEQAVLNFLFARLKAMYQEQGYDSKIIQSVLSRAPSVPTDFDARISAVKEFAALDAAETLIAANKRVANILRKAQEEGDIKLGTDVDTQLFESEHENSLHAAVSDIKDEVIKLVASQGYTEALNELAKLKDTVDDFFENVMVNADDSQIRKNRLNSLNNLRSLFLHIADVSVLN